MEEQKLHWITGRSYNLCQRMIALDSEEDLQNKYMNSLMTEEIENDVLFVQEVGVNRSALQKMLARLQEKRYVERDDKGGWRVSKYRENCIITK